MKCYQTKLSLSFLFVLKLWKRLQSDRIIALKKDLLYELFVYSFSAFVWSWFRQTKFCIGFSSCIMFFQTFLMSPNILIYRWKSINSSNNWRIIWRTVLSIKGILNFIPSGSPDSPEWCTGLWCNLSAKFKHCTIGRGGVKKKWR